MDKQDSIQRRRSEILTELAGLDRMRRGSVTEQFVEAAGRDGRHRRRGPYPLYTFKSGGKTVSRRLRGEDVAMYREQVQVSHRFQELMHELMELGEALCDQTLRADSDGAAYNKTIAQTHFPGALHIIDLYHAREHLTLLGDTLRIPLSTRAQWSDLLDAGNIESLGQAAQKLLPRNGPRRHLAIKQISYFEKNAERMRYADFRAQGLFVGSGVIEAGCRTVV